MKGFGIYVKNDLLEPKHIKAMGASVWLYLWLLDKMTSVSEDGIGKILGGRPITYDEIYIDLGITRDRYVDWLKSLRDGGYINTLRTPNGLVITIIKAKKKFKHSLSDVGKTPQSDVGKVGNRCGKSTTSNIRQYNDNTNNNTTNVVLLAKADVGKPEINELFDYWENIVGYKIQSKVKQNRFACSNLIKKYTFERTKKLIDGVALVQQDRYGPGINDFIDLQAKTNALIAWGKKKHNGTLSVGRGIKL